MTTGSILRGSLRPGGGRTPPFLIIGLLVICGILGFNYWNLTAEYDTVVKEIGDLQDKFRISSLKREHAEKQNEAVERRFRDAESQLGRVKITANLKEQELAKTVDQLESKNAEVEKLKLEVTACQGTSLELKTTKDTVAVLQKKLEENEVEKQRLLDREQKLISERQLLRANLEESQMKLSQFHAVRQQDPFEHIPVVATGQTLVGGHEDDGRNKPVHVKHMNENNGGGEQNKNPEWEQNNQQKVVKRPEVYGHQEENDGDQPRGGGKKEPPQQPLADTDSDDAKVKFNGAAVKGANVVNPDASNTAQEKLDQKPESNVLLHPMLQPTSKTTEEARLPVLVPPTVGSIDAADAKADEENNVRINNAQAQPAINAEDNHEDNHQQEPQQDENGEDAGGNLHPPKKEVGSDKENEGEAEDNNVDGKDDYPQGKRFGFLDENGLNNTKHDDIPEMNLTLSMKDGGGDPLVVDNPDVDYALAKPLAGAKEDNPAGHEGPAAQQTLHEIPHAKDNGDYVENAATESSAGVGKKDGTELRDGSNNARENTMNNDVRDERLNNKDTGIKV